MEPDGNKFNEILYNKLLDKKFGNLKIMNSEFDLMMTHKEIKHLIKYFLENYKSYEETINLKTKMKFFSLYKEKINIYLKKKEAKDILVQKINEKKLLLEEKRKNLKSLQIENRNKISELNNIEKLERELRMKKEILYKAGIKLDNLSKRISNYWMIKNYKINEMSISESEYHFEEYLNPKIFEVNDSNISTEV